KDDPLAARLDDLQAHALARGNVPRRRGGGLLNDVLYYIAMIPGADGWLDDVQDELAHAGVRRREALALYAFFHLAFLGALLGGALYMERNQPFSSKFGVVISAVLLGWLLPQQVLHHLVKRYRQKLQDALPDTVDLLGIVLGTGLALDQAM